MARNVISLVGFTSDKIKSILAEYHNKDVFVTECKNGSTWTNKHLLKLDAWVLKRTYSPLITIGYEIKVDRQDFEQDQKWIDYLPYCHEFFFACPAGLVRSDELPNNVGLVWVSSTGKPHIKHRAEHRQPDTEKLNALMTYIIMSRSIIVGDMNATTMGIPQNEDRLKSLREVVQMADDKKELAYFVKGHIRKMEGYYKEQNANLQTREDNIKRFSNDLARLGITWNPEVHDWQDTYRVENEIALLKNQLDNTTLYQMKTIGQGLLNMVSKIDEYRAKTEKVTTNESR